MSPGSSSRASGGAAVEADGLAGGIARLRRALRRGARAADPGNTLAVAQLELLAALAEHPGARPGELARLLNMRPPRAGLGSTLLAGYTDQYANNQFRALQQFFKWHATEDPDGRLEEDHAEHVVRRGSSPVCDTGLPACQATRSQL